MLFMFLLLIPIATRGGNDCRRVGVSFSVGVGSGNDLEGGMDVMPPSLSLLPSSRGVAPQRGGAGEGEQRPEDR
jgi:hypothetical protein